MPSLGVRSAAVILLVALAVGLTFVRSWGSLPGDGRTVTVGCTECPPFADSKIASPMNGFATDVIAAAAHRLRVPIQFIQVTNSAREGLFGGKVDVWPRLSAEPREEGKLFFSDPWVAMNYCLLSKRGWEPHPGARISVDAGRSQERMAKQSVPGAELVPAVGGKLLQQICTGEVEAAFVESRVLAALLLSEREPQCDGIRFQTKASQEAAVPASIAARPGSEWAARALRAEIGRMAIDGSLASLHAKWFLITSVQTGALDRLHLAERDLSDSRILAAGFAGFLLLLSLQTWRLRKSRAQAERSSGLKTRFVANVSHELRTPLSGIIGLVDMLSDTRVTAHQTELLRTVRSTAVSLVQIIKDLLDVAKVEAGQLEIERTPFELRAAIDEVSAVLAAHAAEKGIRLEIILEPKLPRRMIGDVTRLREILMSVLGHSLRYTDEGEVRLTVGLDQATPFQWTIAFTVVDTGIGIPPEDVARLLQDIESEDVAARGSIRRGGGLGLMIGKRLADLLGGTISVESPGGKGARYRLVLPFEVAAGADEEEEAVDTSGAKDGERPLRVLVCEDDPVNRKVAVHMLAKLRHDVQSVNNGSDAIQLAGNQRFDLVLMDCQLPDIDGYEAARRIRAGGASAGVPVVALTAADLDEDRRRCEEAGMEGFLAKPLSLAALSKTLAELDIGPGNC